MALTLNTHEESSRQFPLIVGLANVVPLAINPDKESLNAMGVPANKEPDYLYVDQSSGAKKRILSFWFGAEQINAFNPTTGENEVVQIQGELKFFVPTTLSNTYMDSTGKFAGNPSSKAFNTPETIELTYSGLWNVISLVRAFARTGFKDVCSFDDAKKLIEEGDMSEIESMFNECIKAGHRVKLLFGVKDGKYQVINSRAFAMDNTDNLQYFANDVIKGLEYEKGYFGDIFSDTSVLQFMNATTLKIFQVNEALAYEDQLASRKGIQGGNRPAGAPGAAPAPPAPAAPASGGRLGVAPAAPAVGGPLAAAAAPAVAPPAPGVAPGVVDGNQDPRMQAHISSDDDNDLPF